MGKRSRSARAASTREFGGSDRGAEDPIPRVTKRPTQRGFGRSDDRWLGEVFVRRWYPIQGDLELGPRPSVLRRRPFVCNCGGRSGPCPRVGKRPAPPSRRDGGHPIDRRSRATGHGSDLGINDPIAVSDQRSGGSWPDRRARYAAVAADPTRRRSGGRPDRPAACSEPSSPRRRWEPDSCV